MTGCLWFAPVIWFGALFTFEPINQVCHGCHVLGMLLRTDAEQTTLLRFVGDHILQLGNVIVGIGIRRY